MHYTMPRNNLESLHELVTDMKELFVFCLGFVRFAIFHDREFVEWQLSFLQPFSDKSKTSVKVRGLKFYALQVNVINVDRNIQHRMATEGHSIPAYLLVNVFVLQSLRILLNTNTYYGQNFG